MNILWALLVEFLHTINALNAWRNLRSEGMEKQEHVHDMGVWLHSPYIYLLALLLAYMYLCVERWSVHPMWCKPTGWVASLHNHPRGHATWQSICNGSRLQLSQTTPSVHADLRIYHTISLWWVESGTSQPIRTPAQRAGICPYVHSIYSHAPKYLCGYSFSGVSLQLLNSDSNVTGSQ